MRAKCGATTAATTSQRKQKQFPLTRATPLATSSLCASASAPAAPALCLPAA